MISACLGLLFTGIDGAADDRGTYFELRQETEDCLHTPLPFFTYLTACKTLLLSFIASKFLRLLPCLIADRLTSTA